MPDTGVRGGVRRTDGKVKSKTLSSARDLGERAGCAVRRPAAPVEGGRPFRDRRPSKEASATTKEPGRERGPLPEKKRGR
jgi:hypothetical protein